MFRLLRVGKCSESNGKEIRKMVVVRPLKSAENWVTALPTTTTLLLMAMDMQRPLLQLRSLGTKNRLNNLKSRIFLFLEQIPSSPNSSEYHQHSGWKSFKKRSHLTTLRAKRAIFIPISWAAPTPSSGFPFYCFHYTYQHLKVWTFSLLFATKILCSIR